MKYLKQKLKKPYDEDGKTNFGLRNKAGVYLIYNDTELRYIGYSGTDVYKTMYRHFQSWKDKTQVRVTYKNIKYVKCRIVYCNNSKQAEELERALIVKYKPIDNPNKYDQYILTYKDENNIKEYIQEEVREIIVNDNNSEEYEF